MAQGLIPARAGNTLGACRFGFAGGAHPRSRGEHRLSGVWCRSWWGSSPLARGTQINTDSVVVHLGLIPARAGNTQGSKCQAVDQRAHPRSRGEHYAITPRSRSCSGSSPLARGTLSYIAPPAGLGGLIPARAGNTFVLATAAHLEWAHPRSRGEHSRLSSRRVRPLGSSPLARGTRSALWRISIVNGLIPARAGNTVNKPLTGEQWRAHPRSRGEHGRALWACDRPRGSSPLARGTLHVWRGNWRGLGLIPARAGNTCVPIQP